MKRSVATVALIALCSVALGADVTVTTTTTIEGPLAAMMNGASPRMITRIKGMKSRTDLEFQDQTLSTIIDLATKQAVVLIPAQKTAQVVDAASVAARTGSTPGAPRVDAVFEPTGRMQTINGQRCDEFRFSMSLDMSQAGAQAPQIPKEAFEVLKDARMATKGVMCLAKTAPGAAEYAAFQKAAIAANLLSGAASLSGLGAAQGSIDQTMRLFARPEGIPYLVEADTSLEGTAPIIDLIKQLAAVKMINKVTEVSVAPIADDLFTVPADYTYTKP